MIETVSMLSLVVGIGYIVFSILIISVLGREIIMWLLPQKSIIRLLAMISIVSTTMFFLGCAEHHLHLAYHIYYEPDMFSESFLAHMFWEELVQVIGVWGPIPLILIIRSILKNIRNNNIGKIA